MTEHDTSDLPQENRQMRGILVTPNNPDITGGFFGTAHIERAFGFRKRLDAASIGNGGPSLAGTSALTGAA